MPRSSLRSIGFDVIPVEILIRAGSSPSHGNWTILIYSIVGARSFVTVSVVDGNEEQHYILKHARHCLGDRQVSEQCKAGIFTIRFPRMNAGLNENYCFFTCFSRSGSECHGFTRDQEWQITTLTALPKALKLDNRGS